MQAVEQLKTMNMLLGKFHRMKQQFEKEQEYSSYWWCSFKDLAKQARELKEYDIADLIEIAIDEMF